LQTNWKRTWRTNSTQGPVRRAFKGLE